MEGFLGSEEQDKGLVRANGVVHNMFDGFAMDR